MGAGAPNMGSWYRKSHFSGVIFGSKMGSKSGKPLKRGLNPGKSEKTDFLIGSAPQKKSIFHFVSFSGFGVLDPPRERF